MVYSLNCGSGKHRRINDTLRLIRPIPAPKREAGTKENKTW